MSPVGWLLLVLALVVVAVIAAVARRREVPPPPTAARDANDLATLGLSEVRPRAASDESEPVPTEGRLRKDARAHSLPRPAGPRPVRAEEGAPETVWARASVRHLLRSLAAHVEAPVAVVRHDGERFEVEARTDGGPLEPVRGEPLALDAPRALDAAALGGLAAVVGGDAYALPLGDHLVLLGGRAAPADGYLRLLAALADVSLGGEETDEATPVPRAEIIAEEQAAAAAAERPLAFALVTLADAEERLTGDDPEAVAVAEAALRDRLGRAPDVGRVEPFGDLLFGVFLALEPAAVARWCDHLASGDPPLFIGAVAPADGDPTGIRNAAAEALHDAYDQRRARVVEV